MARDGFSAMIAEVARGSWQTAQTARAAIRARAAIHARAAIRARAAILAALAATSAATANAAEPTPADVSLAYAASDARAACPDRDAFAAAVATRLGYDPFATGAEPRRRLVVQVHRDGDALVADLRLTEATAATQPDEGATKRITSESGACDELGQAAAFAAAILVDPRAMFPKPKPTGGEPLDSRAPGTWPWYEPPPTLPPPLPRRPEEAPEPLEIRAGLSATGCVGCAPHPNVGASLFAGIEKGHLGLDLGVRGDLPRATSGPSGRSVESALVLAEVFPHGRFGPLRPGVLGAFGASLGESNGERHVSPWTALGARVALEWVAAPPLFLRVALDGLFVLGRVSLRADGGELWSTAPFVGAANLGLGIRLR